MQKPANTKPDPKFSGLVRHRFFFFIFFQFFKTLFFIFTDPLAFNGLNPEGAEDCDIEQHITIIPNPRAKRRGSMADHAFPELHGSRAGKKARVYIVLRLLFILLQIFTKSESIFSLFYDRKIRYIHNLNIFISGLRKTYTFNNEDL